MAHQNKQFDKKTYDTFDPLAKRKFTQFLEAAGYKANEPPPKDIAAHYDIIARCLDVAHRIELEVRRKNWYNLYRGNYPDVRFPKRKFFKYCDTEKEVEDLPDFICTMDRYEDNLTFIIADKEAIRHGIPDMYRDWNEETNEEELFVPLNKKDCYRFKVRDGKIISDGVVADG